MRILFEQPHQNGSDHIPRVAVPGGPVAAWMYISGKGHVQTMSEISAARESVLYDAANTLLDARRTGTPIADLPADLAPLTDDEAFLVQDIMAEAFGEIGGWKIGARDAEATPFFAPMPAGWVAENGSLVRGPMHRLHGVECEIAFRLGRDLPRRSTAYTRDEVVAAVETCHPAIEILESALLQPLGVARESMLADMQMHGGFLAGPAVPGWQTIDWAQEKVTLLIDGSVRAEKTASNPAGTDLLRLLVYLANEGGARTRGLRAGQWITTGSWTGATWTTAGAEVIAHFEHAGRATLQFASRKL